MDDARLLAAFMGTVTLSAIVANAPSFIGSLGGFEYFLYRKINDRCPRCGYRWEQPVAFLQGKDCW